MRCNIIWTDPTNGNEILENVRHTDEIIEHEGMSEETAARFEREMKNPGRYHLDKDRCVWPARETEQAVERRIAIIDKRLASIKTPEG